jgi:hypothetical protein
MTTDQITINVAPDVARAYREANDEDRRKLDVLMSLRLSDALRTDHSLPELMREIGQSARSRGLTPENPRVDPQWRLNTAGCST